MKINKVLLVLNKQNLLNLISPTDVYSFYLNNKDFLNKSFSSPFREDHHPSFTISKSSLTYYDYATGDRGDCFSFVKKLYNLNYNEALKQIAYDLGISQHFDISNKVIQPLKTVKIRNITRTTNEVYDVKVTIRDFQDHDYAYWNSYGISKKFLTVGNIRAISHYFLNNMCFNAEKYAYVYIEKKDDKVSYKIYQPFSLRKKWINANNFSVWELWYLLPKKHENLIITSSRKDALSIIENVKIPSTSFQAESVMPKKQVIEEVFDRFTNVYLLYDNDYDKASNWGQLHAKKLTDKYNMKNIIIPEHYKAKDFSDLVKKYGRYEANVILKNLLK